MRTWQYDLYADDRSFSELRQGKHARPYVQDDEECHCEAWEWVSHMLLLAEGRGAGFEIVEVIATYLDACNK